MKRKESKTEKLKTVAIVDDDPSVLKALMRACRLSDWLPKSYGSAEEFLTSGDSTNCLISDVGLPGISGLELQQAVNAAHPRLPVIMITGRTDRLVRTCAMENGAVEVLRKPLDTELLLQTIQQALDTTDA
jgi:two-component system response regulator FixJ